MGLGSHCSPLGPVSSAPGQRWDPRSSQGKLFCPSGCGPKRASPSSSHWAGIAPVLAPSRGCWVWTSPREQQVFSESLQNIKHHLLPPCTALGQPSTPRGLAVQLERGDKVPAGTWHPRGSLPAPHGAGHDAHPLGSSRLGFETSALFPTDSKGHGWDMGHSPLPAQPPSSGALPGDRESFTPTSFQGLVGATGYHPSHGWDTLG